MPCSGERSAASIPFEELRLCTLDFETTGFHPNSARAVEVAAVLSSADGHVISEMHSILNPEGPVDASWVHGITDSDVRGAPKFKDIAPDLVELLSGAIVVAHNAPFDLRFLQAELGRAGLYIDSLPYACTMRLRSQVGLPGASAHKLNWACWQEGIALPGAHAAIVDARATSELAVRYLGVATETGVGSLGDLKARDASSQTWTLPLPALQLRGRRWLKPRPKPRKGVPLGHSGLSATSEVRPSVVADYRAVLSEAMEDFELTEEEIEVLQHAAKFFGLTSAEIRFAHEEHLRELLAHQAEDGVFSWTEQQIAKTTASLLGMRQQLLDDLLRQYDAKIEGKLEAAPVEELEGMVVCFTGDFEAIPMTRQEVEEFATGIGLITHPRVTKKVDLLVCRDPSLQTAKITKAAEYGTVVISQETFLGLAGAMAAPEGALVDLLARVQARRHAQSNPPKRPKAAPSQPMVVTPDGERVLWCEAGQHEWARPSKRGRLPHSCPEHR